MQANCTAHHRNTIFMLFFLSNWVFQTLALVFDPNQAEVAHEISFGNEWMI